MRRSIIVCASFAASLLATGAMAQSAGGTMGGPMGGAAAASGGMSGPATPNAQGGMGPFSKEDMAMMIVNRDKETAGMTDEQKKAARTAEMAHDRAETPAQRMERKNMYDMGWSKLSDSEKADAMKKLDAQMAARAAARGKAPM